MNKNNKLPTLTILVCLPGSGKSTMAMNHKGFDTVVLSSDNIRNELYGGDFHQCNNNKVFELMLKRTVENLLNGLNVIYDATNLKRKNRMHLIKMVKQKVDCLIECVFMNTSYDECINRNNKRTRVVPLNVINRMLKSFEVPMLFEGFDNIIVLVTVEFHEFGQFIMEYIDYQQDNPHHKHSLGVHCELTSKLLHDKYKHTYVEEAALIHDCGKPFCKTFINKKGETTEIAHYYNHNNVGAYFSLCYKSSNDDLLKRAFLIEQHMSPYTKWKQSEKKMLKDKELFGDELFNAILTLHEADKMAH